MRLSFLPRRWLARGAPTCPRSNRQPTRLYREPLEPRDAPAAGDLRVVTYNIASLGNGGDPRPGLNVILRAIGDEAVGGLAQPSDVLLLQEVRTQATTAQQVVNLLNGIYGPDTYARGTVNGAATTPGGQDTQGVVYRRATVQLVSAEIAVGTASTTGQPRQALRYHFRPDGFSPNTDFYVHNSHYKAGDTSTDQNRRLVEAQAIRTNPDGLGPGNQIIYAGDFNVSRSTEAAYQHLLSAGPGQAFDPINRPGSWRSAADPIFRDVYTQAPAVTAPAGLTGGGLDDRFDFQLVTSTLFDGIGLEYRPGSYHPFGNNGSVPKNGSVNDSVSTALPGLPNRLEALDRLATVADHLPAVVDYFVRPTHFTITAPEGVVAGMPFTITVTTRNGPGAVGAYRGTVRFTSMDGLAGLPADYTFTAEDNGSHSFEVVLYGAGGQSITVSEAAGGPVGGSATFSVTPGAAAAFLLMVPETATAGIAFDLTVIVTDAYGNLVPDYTGTVTFSSGTDPAAMLPAEYTFTAAEGGVAYFPGSVTLFTKGLQDVLAYDSVGGVFGVAYATVVPG